MNFQVIELNVMFIWINLELLILANAFFGFKVKRFIKKYYLKLKGGINNRFKK